MNHCESAAISAISKQFLTHQTKIERVTGCELVIGKDRQLGAFPNNDLDRMEQIREAIFDTDHS